MKKIFKVLFVSSLCFNVLAQNTTISPNAIQVPSIASLPICGAADNGKTVFNTTDKKMYYCNGSAWIDFSNNGFSIPYSATATNANDLISITQNGTGRAIYAKTGFSASPQMGAGFAIVGEGFTGGGVFGVTNSGTALMGVSNTGTGISGNSTLDIGVYGYSFYGKGVSGYSENGIGGVFYNNSGLGAGLVAGKHQAYNSATYTNNSIADLEVRHRSFGAQQAWGLVGLRVFNVDVNKGWTFYTDAQGNLVLFQNNNFIGYFDPNDKEYHINSDVNAKTNILSIPSILSKINQLSPKYYNYLNSEKQTLGFIAQDVEKVFPELVSTALDGKQYSLNYNGFGVLAVKAIQEQQETIKNQQSQIDALLKRVELIENKK